MACVLMTCAYNKSGMPLRGKREDHAWLDELERKAREPIFPMDVYERLWYLKAGEPFTSTGADGALALANT